MAFGLALAPPRGCAECGSRTGHVDRCDRAISHRRVPALAAGASCAPASPRASAGTGSAPKVASGWRELALSR